MNIDWQKIQKECPKSYNKLLNCYGTLIREACYCDLEKFFDDNGIIIEIYRNPYDKKFWVYNVDFKNDNECLFAFNSRQEAKEAAIYKAFEIMEQQK